MESSLTLTFYKAADLLACHSLFEKRALISFKASLRTPKTF